jgi:hypothetical protein
MAGYSTQIVRGRREKIFGGFSPLQWINRPESIIDPFRGFDVFADRFGPAGGIGRATWFWNCIGPAT